MSYAAIVEADRHLAVLRLLAEDCGYSHNSAVLQAALARLGHTVSRDATHTLLAWLAEQGLATVTALGPLRVATITQRGLDAATGAARVPGVARPRPD